MIFFVGAGPGDVDLITVKGRRILENADLVIYAGSLINTELLRFTKEGALLRNSASMTLEEIIEAMTAAEKSGQIVVRLHTGDPSLYGAIREQMEMLEAQKIPFATVPGVSSFLAAAASLHAEYTPPGVSQTLILTRLEGRTPVPEKEDIGALAAHQASMAVFLSAGLIDELCEKLQAGYDKDTPAAIVYKASWPDEKMIRTTVAELPEAAKSHGISKTALILVGRFLDGEAARSLLYDPAFSHGFRAADKD
ncbi:MAG: precorrin-4 C(11)-methyltransferase [Clostridiales bacterium]|nr:precorrin-4 C(11)-methyltransferase [Clostridiales bacterium]